MADPETNADPTPAPAATPEQILAELTKVREEVARERAALAGEREVNQQLQQSLIAMTTRPAPQQAAEPEPDDLPGDEDFDTDRIGSTARVAAAVTKRALTGFSAEVTRELQELRNAQLETEWDKVRAEDPKNFGRLEKGMREYLSKNAYQPGLVRNLFYRMRGEYMPKLQEMDRAEKEREPVASPNPPSSPRKSTEAFDQLDEYEVSTIRGLNVTPESYFGLKHQRQPNFEKGYLKSLGFKEATK